MRSIVTGAKPRNAAPCGTWGRARASGGLRCALTSLVLSCVCRVAMGQGRKDKGGASTRLLVMQNHANRAFGVTIRRQRTLPLGKDNFFGVLPAPGNIYATKAVFGASTTRKRGCLKNSQAVRRKEWCTTTLGIKQRASVMGITLAVVWAAGAAGAHAQNLPEAPAPPQAQEPTTPATHVPVPATRPSSVAALNRRQWSGVVEPGEKIPPLTVREKLLFPAHEEFRWTTAIPILFSGTYGVLRNSDPKLGTDASAFGERMGESALRQGISRELSDSLLPIAFHEDPRYYRMAYGSYTARTEHAIRRVFLSQRDSGAKTFNFSDVLGRGMGAALTQTYYPQASIRPGVVFKTWGLSLAALGGGNLFEEFWPDVKVKLFHKEN
jgi:hypothetical protein